MNNDTTVIGEESPCPFCGGQYLFAEKDDYDRWTVLCYRCDAEGPLAKTKEESIKIWKKRANE